MTRLVIKDSNSLLFFYSIFTAYLHPSYTLFTAYLQPIYKPTIQSPFIYTRRIFTAYPQPIYSLVIIITAGLFTAY